jgi:outer membrane protein assembly factor BamB
VNISTNNRRSLPPASILVISAIVLMAATLRGDDWPQWRGPFRNGHAGADAAAIGKLSNELMPTWRIAIGGGFSSPVISGTKLIYCDGNDGQEIAHCIDAATGKELWKFAYAPIFQDEWGAGPRSTPIIEGDRVYLQSCTGEFRCLSMADGKIIWQTSFEKDWGVKFLGSKANEGTASRRGNNGSGVIFKDMIVLPVGNTQGASLVSFDKKSGKVLWKSQNDEAAYSSFMTGKLAGMDQIVALTADALLAVAPQDGSLLWRVPLKTNAKRHAASPVIFEDTVTVNSHTFGMICERISRDSGRLQPTQAWANKTLKINLSTPVEVGGYFYCQGANKDYVCVDARTGTIKWSQPGFGPGTKDNSSTIAVKDKLLILAYDGQLILAAADPGKYSELGRWQICGNTWSHPAYAQGRFYVRDGRELSCFQLSK